MARAVLPATYEARIIGGPRKSDNRDRERARSGSGVWSRGALFTRQYRSVVWRVESGCSVHRAVS